MPIFAGMRSVFWTGGFAIGRGIEHWGCGCPLISPTATVMSRGWVFSATARSWVPSHVCVIEMAMTVGAEGPAETVDPIPGRPPEVELLLLTLGGARRVLRDVRLLVRILGIEDGGVESAMEVGVCLDEVVGGKHLPAVPEKSRQHPSIPASSRLPTLHRAVEHGGQAECQRAQKGDQ